MIKGYSTSQDNDKDNENEKKYRISCNKFIKEFFNTVHVFIG